VFYFLFSAPPAARGVFGAREDTTTTSPRSRSCSIAPRSIILYVIVLYFIIFCNIILICRESHTSRDGDEGRFSNVFEMARGFSLSLGCFHNVIERYTYAYMNVYYGNNNIVYYYEEPRWSVVAVQKLPFRFHRLHYYMYRL